jgi:hypothetical protein
MYNNRQLFWGCISGIAAPAFVILMFYASRFGNYSFSGFVETAVSQNIAAPLLALSMLANLALFFIYLRKNMLWASRGVIFSMLLYGSLIVYFKFIA